jgi:UDP-glucose 4-epimerase
MQKQLKRAVVTGGAGYIGSHLTEELIKSGEWSVDVIDVRDPDPVVKNATYHKVDIRHYDVILPIIQGADAVFHLAALPRVQYSIEYPAETNDHNINGTLSVLRAAHEGKARRVVYSSSSSAYGDQPTLPLVETMPTRPLSPYGLQKLVGEEYTRIFAEIYGLPTVSLRYFNVYGGRMKADDPYALVLGIFLKEKKAGRPLPITGDGEQTRDFTHIRDVVRANILAATSEKVGKGEAMNIGSGNPISVNTLAGLVGGPTVYVPARKEPRHTKASWEKAHKLLGWEPTVKFEEGIKEILSLQGLQ